jgi:branched-chain amino acid transport system permease protein
MYSQILLNGLMLGAIYACIAVGFSLVWGVLNVINMIHGAFIILGGYITFFAWLHFKIHPFMMILPVAVLMFGLGYILQRGMINKVISKPVLTTLTLTFGLEMILYNAMNLVFSATPRRIALDMGSLKLGELLLSVDRIASMVLALTLTGLLYLVLRTSKIGRAIVAVRMDRDAASLMGINVKEIYAITFGIGAFMAGACGALVAVVFPISTSLTGVFLGKAFVICVIGGLGTVPGALVGGLTLGVIESFAGYWLGPQNAILIGFILMLVLLVVRPTGIIGKKGYE